nr:extracellular solute-binding protein [uncultured bacterium]
MGCIPHISSLLVNMKPGVLKDPALEVWGDLAQSWEVSPDRLTLTMKLHPEATWHPRSPATDGQIPDSVFDRRVDGDDIVASWDRVLAMGIGRTDLSAAINPQAPIETVTSPDAATVVLKLARPDAGILPTLATYNAGYFYIVPKESRSRRLDLRRTVIGSGPFYLKAYEPGARIVLGANPGFAARDPMGAGRPFIEERVMAFHPDTAVGLSQFQAGEIYNWPAAAEQALALKQQTPALNLALTSVANFPEKLLFGFAADSPFRDVRVRQAVSYAIDRDAFAEVTGNVQRFHDAGVPIEVRWATMMPSSTAGFPGGTYEDYWLDPKRPEFGAASRYFHRNLDEVRKLVSAAGFPDGLEFEHAYAPPVVFAASVLRIDRLNQILMGAGLRPKAREVDAAEWERTFAASKDRGNFNGIATTIDSGGPDPAAYAFAHLHQSGLRFGGTNPDGFAATDSRAQAGDSFLNERIDSLRIEHDNGKRIEGFNELQRYHAEKVYQMRYPAGISGVAVAWPALANNFVHVGDLNGAWANVWLDETKAPFT